MFTSVRCGDAHWQYFIESIWWVSRPDTGLNVNAYIYVVSLSLIGAKLTDSLKGQADS